MKNRIFLLAALAVFSAIPAQAQRLVRYQGEIEAGYSAGCNYESSGLVNIRLINGIAVGNVFSAGVGMGLDFSPSLFAMTSFVPVFVNMKGYLPRYRDIKPFVSLDMGASIGLTGFASGRSGLLCTPSLGCSFRVGKKDHALNLSVGYTIQNISGGDSGSRERLRFIPLRLGYQF